MPRARRQKLLPLARNDGGVWAGAPAGRQDDAALPDMPLDPDGGVAPDHRRVPVEQSLLGQPLPGRGAVQERQIRPVEGKRTDSGGDGLSGSGLLRRVAAGSSVVGGSF